MLRAFFCAFVVLTSMAHAADLVPKERKNFHVFLLMGQSNMAGSALPYLDDYREASTRVLIQNPDHTWSAAKTPLRGGGMSPGESFARHYAHLHPDITVGLIQCARGGRKLEELAKGGKDRDGAPNYDNTIAAAVAAVRYGVITGVLWHQGESDVGDPKYVERLGVLATDLRKDLNSPELPLVCGELGRFATWTSGFNSRIGNAATAIPHCAVATSEDLLDLGDKVHFSGYSTEILGARYLMQYLTLVEPTLASTFEPTLQTITAAMLAREAAWTGILNGSMSDGNQRPIGWDQAWTGKGSFTVSKDTTDGAPVDADHPTLASLRLSSQGGVTQGSVSQPLRNVAGKTVTITAHIKNDGFTSCSLIVTGINGSWKQTLNQSIATTSETTDWKAVSGTLAIPADVPNCRLALAIDGEGSAWFDNVAITTAATPPALAGLNLLANPDMEAGDATVSNWTSTWNGSGKVAGVRDSTVAQTGTASLRVESVGGAAKGSVSQALKDVAGKTLHCTGWVKSDGKVTTSVGVGAFDADWKMLSWQTLYGMGAGGGQDWTAFDKTIEIPAGAVNVSLSTGIEGDGKAWFDNFNVAVP